MKARSVEVALFLTAKCCIFPSILPFLLIVFALITGCHWQGLLVFSTPAPFTAGYFFCDIYQKKCFEKCSFQSRVSEQTPRTFISKLS